MRLGSRELRLRFVPPAPARRRPRPARLRPRLRLLQQPGVARVRDAGGLEQRILLALDPPGFLPGRLRGPLVRVAFGADRRDLFGRGTERRNLGIAIGTQRVGLLLRGAERGELGVAIGAQRVGLFLRRAERVKLGVAVGANRVGLRLPRCSASRWASRSARTASACRAVFSRAVGERGAFELAGRALFRRFGAHGVELLLGFDAIELKARLGFLEGERACGARRRAGFFAGRVREPVDELADGSGIGRGGAGERGRERLAAHVDRDAEGFELGQRRLGGLRDERSNGRGGLGLRVVVERRGGVVWCRRRRIHLEVRIPVKQLAGRKSADGFLDDRRDCK